MSLLSIPVDLHRTGNQLERIADSLYRIADALERISPPPLPACDTLPKPAQLSDLRFPTPATVQSVRDELEAFAEQNSLIVNTPKFIESIMGFEKEIVEAYGENALKELPWNKAAGGLLFWKECGDEPSDEESSRLGQSANQSTNGPAGQQSAEISTEEKGREIKPEQVSKA